MTPVKALIQEALFKACAEVVVRFVVEEAEEGTQDFQALLKRAEELLTARVLRTEMKNG